MRIFIVGASGAIGQCLVPILVARGDEVVGTTKRAENRARVAALGAAPVVLDLLDAEAVGAAVAEAEPDVVVHEATALSKLGTPRSIDRAFAKTNRLRRAGTDNLIAAALATGVRRVVAQSFAGWPYARSGAPVKSEDDPLDPNPPGGFEQTLAAIRHLEAAVTTTHGLTGVVLRYGTFYGPGTGFSVGGPYFEAVRKRRFPLVADGGGIWSFVHVEDAAAATAAAIADDGPGIYNVVDDDPARVRDWLPVLAEAIGGKPPLRVPRWLALLAAGRGAVTLMTEIRGGSNAKAKRELGWRPRYPSWREGFRTITAGER